MWFDTHCHLHMVEAEVAIEDVMRAARAGGVTEMIAIGIDVASSRRALEIAREYDLRASAGMHPNSADGWNPRARADIEELLRDDLVVAVGETGLDNYWDTVPSEIQVPAFRDHIDLAKEYDKALVIHTRRSLDQAMDLLEANGPPDRFVFHCWQGKIPEMERALEMGAHISFAGNVWSKKAVRKVPAGRYMIETDSPYLTPEPHRGERNQPLYVADVGAAVAAARDEPLQDVARDTTATARRFFGLEG